jgi:Na+-driven multidrug efflux pump
MLTRGDGRIVIRRHHLRLQPVVMTSILRIAWTGIVQGLIGMTSWLGLVKIVNLFGSVAMAGYFIAIRIVMFALLPAWGLSNAAATLVGQNLGAKRPDRAERAVWIAARYDLYFLGAVGLVFAIFARPITSVFASDPTVHAYATLCLRVIAIGFPFYAFAMVMTAAFNGAGDTWTPTLINAFCFWAWEVPLAWLLSVTAGIGPLGVYLAVAIGFSTMAVIALVLFRRGRWKLKTV